MESLGTGVRGGLLPSLQEGRELELFTFYLFYYG